MPLPNELPPEPPQSQKVAVECPQCNNPVIIENPLLKIINDRDFSMAVAGHPEVKCTHCGATLAMAIRGLSHVQWALLPIKPRNAIIIPPPGLVV
jgi:ribosomal protein S27E